MLVNLRLCAITQLNLEPGIAERAAAAATAAANAASAAWLDIRTLCLHGDYEVAYVHVESVWQGELEPHKRVNNIQLQTR